MHADQRALLRPPQCSAKDGTSVYSIAAAAYSILHISANTVMRRCSPPAARRPSAEGSIACRPPTAAAYALLSLPPPVGSACAALLSALQQWHVQIISEHLRLLLDPLDEHQPLPGLERLRRHVLPSHRSSATA
jgi:hypothetical protein